MSSHIIRERKQDRKSVCSYKVTIKGYDDEFVSLQLAKKCWLVLVVPQFKRETKRRVMEELVCLVAFKIGCYTYVSGESLSGLDNEHEQGPSPSGNQEKADDYDFWTDSYASDDDEIPTKQVSQDIMKEMKNFLKSNIVWESHNEILVSPHLIKTTPLVLSCQRDPEALALSLINQDLLYLKKGYSGPEKIVLSLYKFPVVVLNDDDIEERTSRWVNKYVKKFNPYARYGVEHWKNPHAKIFYIRKNKEPGQRKELIYSN
nr:hypothetical protein [Tanacetum cinerariifolium]